MAKPKVQWGSSSAIRLRATRAFGLVVIGLLVLLAVPIALALDVVGSAQAGFIGGTAVMVLVVLVVLGLGAGFYGFRSGLAVRGTYWLEVEPAGLELWRGSARRPVHVLPWTSIAAVGATLDPQPSLWLRREPREEPVPGTELSEVGRLASSAEGSGDWDLGIALEPASGDPRDLEREIAARVRAPR